MILRAVFLKTVMVTLALTAAQAFGSEAFQTEATSTTVPTVQQGIEESSKALTCGRDLEALYHEHGGLKGVEYKAHGPEETAKATQDVSLAIADIFEKDPWGNKPYLVGHFLQNYFEPIYDISRKISKSELGQSQKPKTIQDIEVLLYGEKSLSAKVKALQDAINNGNVFISKAKKKKRVEEVANEVQTCRVSIKKCSTELPDLLASINLDYTNLNKVQRIISDQITIMENIEGVLGDLIKPADEVKAVVTRKINELKGTRTSVQGMMSQTQNLLSTMDKLIAESQEINSSALKQAIINAGAHGHDVSMIIHDKFNTIQSSAKTVLPPLTANFNDIQDYSVSPPFINAQLKSLAQMLVTKKNVSEADLVNLKHFARDNAEYDLVWLWALRLDVGAQAAQVRQAVVDFLTRELLSSKDETKFIDSVEGRVFFDSLKQMPPALAKEIFLALKKSLMGRFPILSKTILDFAPVTVANELRFVSGLELVPVPVPVPVRVTADRTHENLASEREVKDLIEIIHNGGESSAKNSLQEVYQRLKTLEISQTQFLSIIKAIKTGNVGDNPEPGSTGRLIKAVTGQYIDRQYNWFFNYDIVALGLSRIRASSMNKERWQEHAMAAIEVVMDRTYRDWRNHHLQKRALEMLIDMAGVKPAVKYIPVPQKLEPKLEFKNLLALLGLQEANVAWLSEVYEKLDDVNLSQTEFLTLVEKLPHHYVEGFEDQGLLLKTMQEVTGYDITHWINAAPKINDISMQIIIKALGRVSNQNLNKDVWLVEASEATANYIYHFVDYKRTGDVELDNRLLKATQKMVVRMIYTAAGESSPEEPSK